MTTDRAVSYTVLAALAWALIGMAIMVSMVLLGPKWLP